MGRAAIAALALIAISAGCSPSLSDNDGFYACNRSTQCPARFPHCVPEPDGTRRCRERPPLGEGGVPLGDAGMFDYPECSPDRGCGGPDTCISASPTMLGYCSPPCSATRGCPSHDGMPSHCGPDDVCRRGCTSDDDCPEGIECVSGRWPDGPGTACVEEDAASPESHHYLACANDAGCPPPLACINGACSRPCSEPSECLTDEDCVPLPPPMNDVRTCLATCTGIGAPCGQRAMCREAGPMTGRFRCIPNAWPAL